MLRNFFRERASRRHNRRILESWVVSLEKLKHTVVIGSVFGKGGVVNHITGISGASRNQFNYWPSKTVVAKIPYAKFKEEFGLLRLLESSLDSSVILHSHVDPLMIQWCKAQNQKGIPWIHTYHTLYFPEDWGGHLVNWQKEFNHQLLTNARHADIKISISKWLQNHLHINYGIETTYIPNAINVIECDAADASQFTNRTGLKDFVLFASSNSPIKNVKDFILSSMQNPDFIHVVMGYGLSKPWIESEFDIELGGNVFVFGEQCHKDLLDAIAACSVFVVTSKSEGLPTVLMEAMALERTVVGCDTFGTKEVIHSEDYGYLYDHKSIDDLSIKIRRALDKPKGAMARKRILETYDWRVVVPKLDKIYNEIKHEQS